MRSRAAIAALSASVIAMLAFLCLSTNSERHEPAQPEHPRGVPPAPLTVEPARPMPSPRELVPDVNQGEAKPRNPESDLLVKPEGTQWKSLDIPIEIHGDGGMVEGAWASAERALDGTPVTSVSFHEREGSSTANGTMTFRFSYPDTVDDSSRFYLMAYHPRVGFGIEELTFAELRRLAEGTEPIEIHLEPGDTIEGRVVDENGQPIPGARIAAFMRSDSLINQSGLHTFSDEFGNFVMRGITRDNRPHQILASVEVDAELAPSLTHRRRPRRLPRRTVSRGLGKGSFDAQVGVWNVGDISLPSTAAVRRVTPAPEDESELAGTDDEGGVSR